MRKGILTLTLAGLLCSAPQAFAVWNWMRGAVLNDFTDADWVILKAEARAALDNAADGEQVNWSNDDTGNQGAIKPIMTFSYQGQTCRRVAFLNVNKQKERGVANYNLCQQPDQTWAFVADSAVTSTQDQ